MITLLGGLIWLWLGKRNNVIFCLLCDIFRARDYLNKDHVRTAAENLAIQWARFVRQGMLDTEEEVLEEQERERLMENETERIRNWVEEQD